MATKPKERKVDEGVEETFPASDPPAHSTTPKAEGPIKKPIDDGSTPQGDQNRTKKLGS